jgi:hypothetical protein
MNYSLLENFSGIEGGGEKYGENLPVITERRSSRGIAESTFIEASQKFSQQKTFQKV